jgi:hypothetical protein
MLADAPGKVDDGAYAAGLRRWFERRPATG